MNAGTGPAQTRSWVRRILVTLAASTGMLAAAPAVSLATPPGLGAYQGNADAGGFRNILPAGENGFATTADIFSYLGSGVHPPHNNDQLDEYDNLVYHSPNASESDVNTYFKDASFGIQPGHVGPTTNPNCAVVSEPSPNSPHCDDVSIVRDTDYGVPHIYGTDRAAALFGSGYAAAQDRLFFMDVERHLARGTLASLLGGSNAATDRSTFAGTPYAEGDLQQQYNDLNDNLGSDGLQGQADVQNYVDGINQYIAESRVGPPANAPGTMIPGEYVLATNQPTGPEEWQDTDEVAIASLVGGQFGKGGGKELTSGLTLQAAQDQFGATDGAAVWSDFREAEDPETATTVHDGTQFPYEVPPAGQPGTAASVALPDPGSLQTEPVTPAKTRKAIHAAHAPVMRGFTKQHSASNALLVSNAETTGDHPLAVMGPQVGYFSPQILMEQDIHAPTTGEGPGLDARGAGFAGVSLYVLLGRGPDYSWSATSAGQDIIDKYALHLCDPDNPTDPPAIDDDGYWFDDTCTPFEEVTRTDSWAPTPQDPTPAGSQTMTALRTKLGIVTHRGTVGGDPVAFVTLRSTYFHELDSAAGFADFNSPDLVDSPQTFQAAANKIGFTFNWFYADDQHIAYFNSGQNPIRPADVDPNFPVDAPKSATLTHAWQGYDPATHTENSTSFAQHPQVLDQDYISSWNNKQAPAFRAADSEWSDQAVDRVDMLNTRIEAGIDGAKTMSRADLVNAMEDAATVDLRGAEVLPKALKVIQSGKGKLNKKVADAVDTLKTWQKSGAHRLDSDADGKYEKAKAIRIMDAWWPGLVEAEFKPTLGDALYTQIQQMIQLDNRASPGGSAYNEGWYGYVQKDLRSVLGKPVDGAYSREYCGDGKLGACRDALTKSLKKALKHDSSDELYGTNTCTDNNGVVSTPQWCHDGVKPTTLGAIGQPPIQWINRPTFQQVVEIQGHRP